jgi:hypothetical protein
MTGWKQFFCTFAHAEQRRDPQCCPCGGAATRTVASRSLASSLLCSPLGLAASGGAIGAFGGGITRQTVLPATIGGPSPAGQRAVHIAFSRNCSAALACWLGLVLSNLLAARAPCSLAAPARTHAPRDCIFHSPISQTSAKAGSQMDRSQLCLLDLHSPV